MKTTNEWLDQAKRKRGLASDYMLAKSLGVQTSVISHYRARRRFLDAMMAAKVAELAGVDPIQVIASAEAERAKSQDVINFWKRLAACVVIAAGTGAAGAVPSPAQAAQASAPAGQVCIMSNRRRGRKREQIQALAASSLAAISNALGIPRIAT
jgi:predicted transcriptional regulator